MVVYYLIGNWQELTVLTQAAFHLWLAAQDFVPFVAASGRVTRLALAIFPANWVDVFTATKELAKQRDFFIGTGRLGYGRSTVSVARVLGLSLAPGTKSLPQRFILSPQACVLGCESDQVLFSFLFGALNESSVTGTQVG